MILMKRWNTKPQARKTRRQNVLDGAIEVALASSYLMVPKTIDQNAYFVSVADAWAEVGSAIKRNMETEVSRVVNSEGPRRVRSEPVSVGE